MKSRISEHRASARLPVVCWLSVAVAAFQSSLCCAQDAAGPRPTLQQAAAPAGVAHYAPQKWAVLAVEVVNPAAEAKEVVVATYFVEDPNVQYARRLWLPPRTKRRSSFLVLPPGEVPPANGKYQVKTMLLDSTEGDGSLVKTNVGRMFESGMLLADPRPVLTKSLSDQGDESDSPIYEMSIAARISASHSRRLSEFHDEFLPATNQGLQRMDQLILSSDRIAADIAGLTAIRHWLHSGGRLWIMLDQLEPETVNLLLGESFDCQMIDRVGLTDLHIRKADDNLPNPDGKPRNFEEPVELARVIVGSVEVTYTVNGWPAAFWKRVGRGEILFTTLGARGWIRSRTENDPKHWDPLRSSHFVAGGPLRTIADRFFRRKAPPPIEPDQLGPMLTEQIGYRIVGRGAVAATLAAFCGGVLIGGLWLIRRGRPERLGWIGPAAAACAATVIAFLGAMSKSGVPNTLAELQIVQAVSGSEDLQVTGLAAVYNRSESKAVVGAVRSGVFLPDASELRGSVRRMVWTDLDSWHWEHLTLPPGVRTAPFEFSAKMSQPVEARASFGPAGIEGRVSTGSLEDLADAIIATPSRESLAVRVTSDGTFTAGSGNVLAPRQFIADTLVSAEQRRRQDVYRQMIPGAGSTVYPDRPTLLAWTKPVANGFEFPEQTRKLGSALFAIPLVIERTPPGTRVTIPSPFLPYRTDRSSISSPSYDNRAGTWHERKVDTQTWLRVQLPREVLPIKLDHAVVTVHINGPVTKIEIARKTAGQTVVLVSRDDPVGTVKLEIDRENALLLDDDGGLRLGVFVSVPEARELKPGEFDGGINRWKIEYFRVEVEGETLDP